MTVFDSVMSSPFLLKMEGLAKNGDPYELEDTFARLALCHSDD